MKTAIITAAAMAALALTAGTASAGQVVKPSTATMNSETNPYGFFSPLPITSKTSYAYQNIFEAALLDGPSLNNKGSSSATLFTDDYSFTVAKGYGDVTFDPTFPSDSTSHITSYDFSIYKTGDSMAIYSTGTTPAVYGSYNTPAKVIQLDLQPNTSYYAVASVVVPGRDTANYTIGAFGSAVPEPSTWLLMIGGVAMIGGMLRYTRRQQDLALRAA